MKSNIAIYQNLPSGGALATYQSLSTFLSKRFRIIYLKDNNYEKTNLIRHLYNAIILSRINQKLMLKNVKFRLLIVFHSWLVKSPHVLRYHSGPTIYICHEVPLEFYQEECISSQTVKERLINHLLFPIRLIDYWNVRNSSAIIVANSNLSKKLIDRTYGVNSRVIYPGIDVNKFKSINSRYRNKKNQLLCIGAINKYKNQKYLVSVLSKIDINIRPELILIANGYDLNYLNNLKQYAHNCGVGLKVLIGISESEKNIELQQSLAFIYSPIHEPFGLVILEAITAGLPIIVNKLAGGYGEIINNMNGLLFNDYDNNKWATGVTMLLKNPGRIDLISKYNRKYGRKRFDSKLTNMKILELVRENI